MKHKVSQKEWNDKRDAFLCAYINGVLSNHLGGYFEVGDLIASSNGLTSELYEVEEIAPQPTITDKVTAQVDIMHQAAIELKEAEDHIPNVGNKVEDTRPFNPKVVEIFNEFLPKEIAPLAIEAHKKTLEERPNWKCLNFQNLEDTIIQGICFGLYPVFGCLFAQTKGNTITATPEQLREWFPQAYENKGGTND
jgi:hypothetical protein